MSPQVGSQSEKVLVPKVRTSRKTQHRGRVGVGRDHRPQGWEGPGDAGVTTGTGLSPGARLHAFQGTILKEHVCVLSNVFSLIPHKYECLGEKASVPGAGFRVLSPRPAPVLGENHRDRQRGGRAPLQRDDGPGTPCGHQLPLSRRERALTMVPRLVIKATLPRRLWTHRAPSGHDRDITHREHRTEWQPLLFCS